MVALGFSLNVFREVYLARVPADRLPTDAAASLFDGVMHFIRLGLRSVLVLFLAAAAMAWVSGPGAAPTAVRRGATRGAGVLRHGPSIGLDTGRFGDAVYAYRAQVRFAVLALALVVYVMAAHPTGQFALVLLGLTLLVLLVVEVAPGHRWPRPRPDPPGPGRHRSPACLQPDDMEHTLAQPFLAGLGTFVLVLGGCGAAVLAAGAGRRHRLPRRRVRLGLTVVTMAYAVGHVSGGHFNPAISLGLALGRRFSWADAVPYAVTQVVAAIAASGVLFVIANGVDGFSAKESGFATNGYGDRSPGGYDLLAVMVAEIVLTAVFLYVILGATDTRAPKDFTPLAIGLSLTLIHLVSIPVSNTSVNPARSTGPALLAGTEALSSCGCSGWPRWSARPSPG